MGSSRPATDDARPPEGARGRVLVVDDDAGNRMLLRDLLEARGHEVIEAVDGARALVAAEDARPDVILLDVMMPGLTGFEVCRRLKENHRTQHLPVLLVTALIAREDRLEGIRSGADDFLTKPIDTREVAFRVESAVRAKRLGDRVREDYGRLRDLEAHRDGLTHMIVHDMRAPLTAITGYLDLLRIKIAPSSPERRLVEGALGGAVSLIEMVNCLLDVGRLEAGRMPLTRVSCRVDVLVEEAVAMLGTSVGAERVRIEAPPPSPVVSCDSHLIRRVIANLAGNALKFSPREQPVEVNVGAAGDAARVAVSDRGPGIPPEHHGKIFEKFIQVGVRREVPRIGTGLGLAFCKLVVEAHGGRIGFTSEVGRGSTFWFELPASG